MGRSARHPPQLLYVRRGLPHRCRTVRPAVRPDPDDQLERPGRHHQAIAAGRYDDLIRQRARDTKALGQPVLIRWFWEMDGKKKAEFAGTPEQYIAAWKHIVGIFRTEGADNVRWVWCPNASAFNDGEAQPFYPGPDFVDWTCADGYNWAPGRAGDDYRSFKEIFSGFYLLGGRSRTSRSWWASSACKSAIRAKKPSGSTPPGRPSKPTFP